MDDPDETEEEIPGFSDAEIEAQLQPFFGEVEADYRVAFDPLAEEFRKKGPPPEDSEGAE